MPQPARNKKELRMRALTPGRSSGLPFHSRSFSWSTSAASSSSSCCASSIVDVSTAVIALTLPSIPFQSAGCGPGRPPADSRGPTMANLGCSSAQAADVNHPMKQDGVHPQVPALYKARSWHSTSSAGIQAPDLPVRSSWSRTSARASEPCKLRTGSLSQRIGRDRPNRDSPISEVSIVPSRNQQCAPELQLRCPRE